MQIAQATAELNEMAVGLVMELGSGGETLNRLSEIVEEQRTSAAGVDPDAAAAAGTRITIEAVPAPYGTNFLNTLEEAEAFVVRVDHPAIALILDLGAMHMNGSFAAVPARLPGLAPQLNHVHVSEPDLAPAPADAAALVPVLRALHAGGYAKAIAIEMKRPAQGLAEVGPAIARLVAAQQAAQQAEGAIHA